MSSVVIELQRDLLATNCDIVSALRKAHIIASKLNLTEFDSWILSELNGYKCDEKEIPEYRQIMGVLKAFNPYHGWTPVLFQDGKMEETICNRKLKDSISAIIELSSKSDSSSFQINIPADAARTIDKMCTAPFPTSYIVSFSLHLLNEIIDKVKNCLLEWTLTLEKQGIKGDEMIFNQTETDAAKEVPQQINNYYGTVINGNVEKTQITSGDNNTVTMNIDIGTELANEIRESLKNEQLSPDDMDNANELVDEVETKIIEKKSPLLIKSALSGLKEYLICLGANVTADLINAKMMGLF
ncbi:MAG: ABC transporter substrate-binding protein [Ruminococcus sp.]|nr:ABC transporter substrate-binding protein [Ruminococcus sp.]